jgi:hypothetical protein
LSGFGERWEFEDLLARFLAKSIIAELRGTLDMIIINFLVFLKILVGFVFFEVDVFLRKD